MPGISAIGNLDKRITFQQKVYGSPDGSNQRKVTGWENIDSSPTVWAELYEKSGTEILQADQLNGLTMAEFRIRFRTDLTIENRVVYNDKNYDIQAILEMGRRKYLRLICESGGQYTQ
jgi:SPP1 family predicted phage head-tail adaptor